MKSYLKERLQKTETHPEAAYLYIVTLHVTALVTGTPDFGRSDSFSRKFTLDRLLEANKKQLRQAYVYKAN